MAGICRIRFGKKEKELRGLINLIKENDENLSAYCSFALQHFIRSGQFVKIADVVPADNEEESSAVIYLEKTLMEDLQAYMDKIRCRNRSKVIRLILMRSIEISKDGKGYLSSRFDMNRALMDESITHISARTEKPGEKKVSAEIKKPEHVEKKVAVKKKVTVNEKSNAQIRKKPEPAQSVLPSKNRSGGEVLDALFPIVSDLDWD